MFPFSQEMRSDQAALIPPASREGVGTFLGSVPWEALESESSELRGEAVGHLGDAETTHFFHPGFLAS